MINNNWFRGEDTPLSEDQIRQVYKTSHNQKRIEKERKYFDRCLAGGLILGILALGSLYGCERLKDVKQTYQQIHWSQRR